MYSRSSSCTGTRPRQSVSPMRERGLSSPAGTGLRQVARVPRSIMNGLLKTPNRKPGIKAVIVYPMNALINSQESLSRKITWGSTRKTRGTIPLLPSRNLTGQSRKDARFDIHENPPDILLTNYMMLEVLLTRGGDSVLKSSIYENLRWLALNGGLLHTYRGRQGADVAMLITAHCGPAGRNEILCMGTSADHGIRPAWCRSANRDCDIRQYGLRGPLRQGSGRRRGLGFSLGGDGGTLKPDVAFSFARLPMGKAGCGGNPGIHSVRGSSQR